MKMPFCAKPAILFVLAVLVGFTEPPNVITVYLIGDSTMADKEIKTYPETGWGMPFRYFFDASVKVENRAQNGRSTRSFMEENRWTPVTDSLKEGDYVFIQFGHNDEVVTKKTYTTEEQFQAYLLKYVTDTRAKKAIPVLLTPVARRNFDSAGVFHGTHDVYSELVRNVARKNNVLLIDLDKESQALLIKMGKENSQFLYNMLQPGEHPNYPEGKTDNTHFNEFGARKMAEIVLAEIRKLELSLTEHIVNTKATGVPVPKK